MQMRSLMRVALASLTLVMTIFAFVFLGLAQFDHEKARIESKIQRHFDNSLQQALLMIQSLYYDDMIRTMFQWSQSYGVKQRLNRSINDTWLNHIEILSDRCHLLGSSGSQQSSIYDCEKVKSLDHAIDMQVTSKGWRVFFTHSILMNSEEKNFLAGHLELNEEWLDELNLTGGYFEDFEFIKTSSNLKDSPYQPLTLKTQNAEYEILNIKAWWMDFIPYPIISNQHTRSLSMMIFLLLLLMLVMSELWFSNRERVKGKEIALSPFTHDCSQPNKFVDFGPSFSPPEWKQIMDSWSQKEQVLSEKNADLVSKLDKFQNETDRMHLELNTVLKEQAKLSSSQSMIEQVALLHQDLCADLKVTLEEVRDLPQLVDLGVLSSLQNMSKIIQQWHAGHHQRGRGRYFRQLSEQNSPGSSEKSLLDQQLEQLIQYNQNLIQVSLSVSGKISMNQGFLQRQMFLFRYWEELLNIDHNINNKFDCFQAVEKALSLFSYSKLSNRLKIRSHVVKNELLGPRMPEQLWASGVFSILHHGLSHWASGQETGALEILPLNEPFKTGLFFKVESSISGQLLPKNAKDFFERFDVSLLENPKKPEFKLSWERTHTKEGYLA